MKCEVLSEQWREQALKFMDTAGVSTARAYKAYRDASQLFQELRKRYPDVPEEAWNQKDKDWLTFETLKGHWYNRLCTNKKPVMWLRNIVPCTCYATNASSFFFLKKRLVRYVHLEIT